MLEQFVMTVKRRGMRKKIDYSEFENVFEEVEAYEVNYTDLGYFITEKYELEENFQVLLHGEFNNDTLYSYDINGYNEGYDIEEVFAGKSDAIDEIEIILNDMCAKGWIPEARYLLNVSW